MTTKERYESAKELYASIGVNTDKAIETLKKIPISLHCWQGDDVTGFDHDGPLSRRYSGYRKLSRKSRNPQELMDDIDEVLKLVPGKHKLNLHASYAIFEPGEFVDRDKLEPKHLQNG